VFPSDRPLTRGLPKPPARYPSPESPERATHVGATIQRILRTIRGLRPARKRLQPRPFQPPSAMNPRPLLDSFKHQVSGRIWVEIFHCSYARFPAMRRARFPAGIDGSGHARFCASRTLLLLLLGRKPETCREKLCEDLAADETGAQYLPENEVATPRILDHDPLSCQAKSMSSEKLVKKPIPSVSISRPSDSGDAPRRASAPTGGG
jgi:hypothetical protein